MATDADSPCNSVRDCTYLWDIIFGKFFYLNAIGYLSWLYFLSFEFLPQYIFWNISVSRTSKFIALNGRFWPKADI